jgi:transcription elongation factor GreA
MIKDHKEYITKAKQKELITELEQLKTVDRKEIAEKLDYARSLGDLSENAEYHDAREQQSELEGKIEHIENILNIAEIVTSKKSDTVILGSTVTLQKASSTTTIEYVVVGSAEADMLAHKLSHESPLGAAMLGKKVGDKVLLETPKGKVTYTIKKLA